MAASTGNRPALGEFACLNHMPKLEISKGAALGLTAVDLYRMGNSASARLDQVRLNDITHMPVNGIVWVRAGTGGVSTFSVPGPFKGRWWKLLAGFDYGALLVVWNDHAQHWSWEPARDMPLASYLQELSRANLAFA